MALVFQKGEKKNAKCYRTYIHKQDTIFAFKQCYLCIKTADLQIALQAYLRNKVMNREIQTGKE